MNCNSLNEKSGLKLLVNFQRITGQSYLLWNFGKRMGLKMKMVLIILNTLLFVATLYHSYINVEGVRKISKNNQNLFTSQKSTLYSLIDTAVYICFAVMNIYVFGVQLFRGKTILLFLYDMDLHIDGKIERKIGVKAMIIQITITLFMSLSFILSDIVIDKILKNMINDIFPMFFECVLIIITFSSYLSFISIMAYFCFVIEQKFVELHNEFTSLTKLTFIFKQIITIHSCMKKFNEFYKRYLFFMLALFSIQCIKSLTLLYFVSLNTITNSVVSIVESLTNIILLCYLSDKIEKSYASIINKYEQLQLETGEMQLNQVNYCMVNRLYGIRDDMCFTALNLYQINMKTFVSIISMIVTFSVIFIQTRD